MRSVNFSKTGQLSHCNSWELIWDAGPYFKKFAALAETANHSIVIVGWQIDSHLKLAADLPPLKDFLLKLLDQKPDLHLYFLIWDYATFYVFDHEWWQSRLWENIHPRIHFVFDGLAVVGGSHHEKLIIFDEATALVGGIDLCEGRWDSIHHHYRDHRRSIFGFESQLTPYHDLAVQVTGAICQLLLKKVYERWIRVSSTPFPFFASASPSLNCAPVEPKQVVLCSQTQVTLCSQTHKPFLTREIEQSYRWQIQSAEQEIYIENQYYWSTEIHCALLEKIRTSSVKLTLILPMPLLVRGLPQLLIHSQLSLLKQLAETGRDQVQIYFPISERLGPGNSKRTPIYVHSKVLVIDDKALTIGSANLAARSLRVDGELNLTFLAQTPEQRSKISALKSQLLAHWHFESDSACISSSNPEPGSTVLQSGSKLVKLNPEVALQKLRTERPILSFLGNINRISSFSFKGSFKENFLVRLLVDPNLPWFYLISKRTLWTSFLIRKNIPLTSGFQKFFSRLWKGTGFTLLLWLALAFGLTLTVQHSDFPEVSWAVLILSSSIISGLWLFPAPMVLVSICLGVLLPSYLASRLVVYGLWLNGAIIWTLFRVSPLIASRLYQNQLKPRTSQTILKILKLRQLPAVLSVSLNPLIPLQSKLIQLSLSHIPFPWFSLMTISVLPVTLFLSTIIVGELLPLSFKNTIYTPTVLVLVLILARGLVQLFHSLSLKNLPVTTISEASQRTLKK